MSEQLSFAALMEHHGFTGTAARSKAPREAAPRSVGPSPVAVFEAARERALALDRAAQEAVGRYMARGEPSEREVRSMLLAASDAHFRAGLAGREKGAGRTRLAQQHMDASERVASQVPSLDPQHRAEAAQRAADLDWLRAHRPRHRPWEVSTYTPPTPAAKEKRR